MSRHEEKEKLPTPPDPRIGRAFLDTVDPAAGTDELTSPGVLEGWLVERKLLEPGTEVSDDDFRRAINFRDGLRAWRAADGKVDQELVASLNWSASMALVRFSITRRLNFRIEPAAEGFAGALGRLLGILLMDPSMGLWPLSEDGSAPNLARTKGGSPNLSRRWPSCRWYGLRCGEWLTSRAVARRRRRRR